MKSYFSYNLDRPSKIWRLRTFLLPRLGPAEQSHRGAMAAGLRGPKLKLQCTIYDEISSYVIYTTRGTRFAHLRWRKQTRESGRRQRGMDDSWRVVTGSSDGPLATRTWRTDSLRSPLAPPCFNFSGRWQIELTWQEILDGQGLVLRPKFDEYGPLFIGVLCPTHRVDRVLHFL
jgi:hypothetical protein